jgi:hypothetical protein
VTVSPVTNFPGDAIALATWQASSGTWNVTGYDQRAVMGRERRLVAGANISLTEANDTVTVAAAVSSFDPMDMTHDIVIDKPGSDLSATTPAGYATVTIGTGPCTGVGEAAGGSDVVGHRVETGEVAGDGCYLVARGENDSPYYGDISGSATFQPFQFRGRLRLVDTMEQKAFLGLFSETTSSASVTDGVYLEYDPAIGSNWQCTVRTGGSATRVNTGVAATTDYVTVEVRATVPDSVTCSVGTTTATVVATFPSAVHFGWYNETTGTVAQGLVVSDVRRKVTGLNR